ncbi:hypothetical protein ACF0H5_011016 [Mactra antiquata]
MIKRYYRILVTLAITLHISTALDNGLTLTPPMGWLTWERFRCITDCKTQPESCISENLIKTMADRLAHDGYKDVGYEYIILDDCWLANERDNISLKLQPDPDRFPSGISNLADYVHQQGLKFGIYADFGVKTCGGYPGSEFYLQLDAQTFADWGVDYVKFDGCNSDPEDMDFGYTTFGFYLNETGRPMVYSCEWPLYQSLAGIEPDYSSIQKTCNLWRNHVDVEDSWDSIQSIIKYYGEDYNNMSMYAQPGAWNDPDMINGTVIEIWSRPLMEPKGSLAIALLQMSNPGAPTVVTVQAADPTLNNAGGYTLYEGFTGLKILDIKGPHDEFQVSVNPNGVVLFVARSL